MLRRVVALVLAVNPLLFPSTAAADWLLSPYLGTRFAASTTFLAGRPGTEGNKVTFGSSVGFLTAGVLGLEADVSFVPGFFTGNQRLQSAVVSSAATTVMGNVIVAAPLGVSQYGLRPYVVGGVGLIRARADGIEALGELINSNVVGMNVGGGAIGPLTQRTSVRFDVRFFRNVTGDSEATLAPNEGLELSFWRGTVGLSFRF